MSHPPLLVLAPIEPCATGNGLAMRAASFAVAAAHDYDVHVAVVPVAGQLPRCPHPIRVPVTVVGHPGHDRNSERVVELMRVPFWRQLLARADPMPPAARIASPELANDVVEATGSKPRTPVHVIRSYLAPLGLAIADHLSSEWISLDLDDDDEQQAAAEGDATASSAYNRLVATFAPWFSALGLASPDEAETVGRRLGLRTINLPNSVEIPAGTYRRHPGGGLFFVGNLTYQPNIRAAVSLVEQVLPALQARTRRDVGVVLVGAHDPEGPIGALASRPSVTVTGWLDDVAHCYEEAGAFVAPIATGGGTRIKLLEAFAHRVPVVTTPAGAAGLGARHEEHLLIAESAEDLAAATARVLDDASLADHLTAAAFELVTREHSPEVVARQVSNFLDVARSTGRVRR